MVNIRKGDSRTISAGFGVVIGADWVCRLQIRKKSDGSLTGVDRMVTTKNVEGTLFTTLITATETTALGEGEFVVSMQVSNPVTDEAKEDSLELKIGKEWVY